MSSVNILSSHLPNGSATGIDSSDNMVSLVKARLGELSENVDFRVNDFRKIGKILSKNLKLNVIFSSNALHHLNCDEKADVVEQALTLLQPGGWFINADLIVAETPEIDKRIQKIRVKGIVRRAKGVDDRFRNSQ